MSITQEAAEIMHRDGRWHTAASFAAIMNITAVRASGLIYNIRNSNKYQIEETPLPVRKIRVVSIKGSDHSNQNLWRLALFGGKAA